jgi:hypothetical protein
MKIRCKLGLHSWGFWFRVARLDGYKVMARICRSCQLYATKCKK